MNVPQSYYDFIMQYAPYFYVNPTAITADAPSNQKNVTVADGTKFQANYPVQISDDAHSEWNKVASINGNVLTMQNNLAYTYYVAKNGKVEDPDPAFGKGAFPAAFAIDFLYQAYSASQFASKQTEIRAKIVELADFILTQQCTDNTKKAYGGFKSGETSTQYWSVDAGRCIPPLLKAYALTDTAGYLDAAKLAGATFLYNMQHEPANLGLHDKYYGGFARYVTINNDWSQPMNCEELYDLIGLKMLSEYDTDNKSKYETMMSDAVGFLRSGFEQLYLWFDPKPTGDGKWHRVGLSETEVYDDPMSFALLGLYTYEGWSVTCQRVYSFIQTIRASAQYPAYNPAICWPGYIDVITRFPACAYYDALTSGILWKIRAVHDKPSLALSMQIINKYQNEFLASWGPVFTDYSPITAQKAMANTSWLAQLFLNYADPITNFTRILDLQGENLLLYSIREAAETVTYSEALSIKATVTVGTAGEIMIEPGYILEDHITVYTFLPIRVHDKIRRGGVDYEVLTVQRFDLNGDPEYYKSMCRRLIGQ